MMGFIVFIDLSRFESFSFLPLLASVAFYIADCFRVFIHLSKRLLIPNKRCPRETYGLMPILSVINHSCQTHHSGGNKSLYLLIKFGQSILPIAVFHLSDWIHGHRPLHLMR
jgi:hypothetical protein